jgi:Ca2+:H+ antiporter
MIYAATMIICNGVVGACILVGGLARREQSFRVEGSGAGLAALIAMYAFTLVLPAFTTTTVGGTYSNAQLGFAAAASAALWAVFVFVQTVRYRDHFLPAAGTSGPEEQPSRRRIAKRGQASVCCSFVPFRWLGSPNCSRRRSNAGLSRRVRPRW